MVWRVFTGWDCCCRLVQMDERRGQAFLVEPQPSPGGRSTRFFGVESPGFTLSFYVHWFSQFFHTSCNTSLQTSRARTRALVHCATCAPGNAPIGVSCMIVHVVLACLQRVACARYHIVCRACYETGACWADQQTHLVRSLQNEPRLGLNGEHVSTRMRVCVRW